MVQDQFQMAAEGWRIISQAVELRAAARDLLQWLTDRWDIRFAGLQYVDVHTGYYWTERADQTVSQKTLKGEKSSEWRHPIQNGSSYWYVDKSILNQVHLENLCSLLDILSSQLLRVHGKQKAPITKLSTSPRSAHPSWVAVSPASRRVAGRFAELGASNRPLLLIGETGSGRNHLARIIHNYGPDPSVPFYTLGKETKESVVFCPDWSKLSPKARYTVLGRPFRVIAAIEPTDVSKIVESEWNHFTHLTGRTLKVPSLRNRREDIPLLAGGFLGEMAMSTGYPVPGISPAALEALITYRWPGNVRELIRVMGASLDNSKVPQIMIEDLPPAVRGAVGIPSLPSFQGHLVAQEYEALVDELSRQEGHIARTAQALGMTSRQVAWRIRKYGINRQNYKPGSQSS